jgi:antitoxin component of MazEF toxin-antitoxin module
MKAQITRIGNSQGIRIPKTILDLYRLSVGDQLELSETREGIQLCPAASRAGKLSWGDDYDEMARKAAERAEWDEWDGVAGDGIDD